MLADLRLSIGRSAFGSEMYLTTASHIVAGCVKASDCSMARRSTLTRKAIELAKGGDPTALRLCIERILPARKDRPVSFNMPPIVSVADSVKATAAIAAAVADGDLTPMEAAELSKLVDAYTRAVGTIMTRSLKARLTRLEVKSGKASTRFIVVADEAECNALAVAGSIPAGARLYQ